LEHIRSVSSELPEDYTKQRKWFRCILQYYTGIDFDPNCGEDALRDIITKWLDNKDEQTKTLVVRLLKCSVGSKEFLNENAKKLFDDIVGELNEHKSFDIRDDLGNLALLDEETNRSYQNAPFPVKRWRILTNNAKGEFIPPCTLNAFLKYYSKIPRDVLIWNDNDCDNYLQAIEELLSPYLPTLPKEQN